MHAPVILRGKLMIPKPGKDSLARCQVEEILRKLPEYPLTVITANAGYGKTTVLAQVLSCLDISVGWYAPGLEDDSVYAFSAYLVSALDEIIPGIRDWYLGNIPSNKRFNWKRSFEVLLNGIEKLGLGNKGILIIDDWHLVQSVPEIRFFLERFLDCKPDELSVVLVSRKNITLSAVHRLRAAGKVLQLQNGDLAFTHAEVEQFIALYAPEKLAPDYVNEIYSSTEGWIMAIRLLLNTREGYPLLPNQSITNLFEYLSYEILNHQTEELRIFLLKSAIPEFIGYEVCEHILGYSPYILDQIVQSGLFLTEIKPGLFRYHNLFRDLLYREAQKRLPDFQDINNKLADFYLIRSEKERALGCYLKSENWTAAGSILINISRDLVYSGRGYALKNYLTALPEEYLVNPEILLSLGDEERLTCNYKKALLYYQQAEEILSGKVDSLGLINVYRGVGENYLDIIELRKTQHYIVKSYRLLGKADRKEKIEILGLLAENKTNQGKPKQAQRYTKLVKLSQNSIGDKNNLQARMLLRTGRIIEAIRVLEGQISLENELPVVHSSFRETPILLSLCYSLVGETEKAVKYAQAIINTGKRSELSLFEAMGYIRLGHALLTGNEARREKCFAAYKKAQELVNRIELIRAESELNMGKCLYFSQLGAWEDAQNYGLQGLDIAKKVQDNWFTAVLYHVLGIAAANCHHYNKAQLFFESALAEFEGCGDSFGKTLVFWWFSYLGYLQNNAEKFASNYHNYLSLASTYGYDFLMERPTILGDNSGEKIEQLWLEVNKLGTSWAKGAQILDKKADSIRIQMLGQICVIRNGLEVPAKEWRRKNALRLFQLFLTKRRVLLTKEEIICFLWPEAKPSVTYKNFKNALYDLCKVLEPKRKPWSSSHYIQRTGSTYYFNLAANFWLDVDDFIVSIEKAKKAYREMPGQAEELLRYALDLYKGDYLAGTNLDEWGLEERERLIIFYIKAAEMLARLLIQKGLYEEAIKWADLIIEKDKFWEQAYQLKIWCYKKLKNKVMVNRTYKECVQRLQDELGIAPSQRTLSIYTKALGE